MNAVAAPPTCPDCGADDASTVDLVVVTTVDGPGWLRCCLSCGHEWTDPA